MPVHARIIRKKDRQECLSYLGNHASAKYTLKTVLLLGLLSGLLIWGGQAMGGSNGIYIGLALAVVMNFASYFFSDKIALSMYSAQPVTETENPEVYRRVEPIVANLTQRMGLPMPKLWLIPDESPNAFATGRNPSHASVAFTDGNSAADGRSRTRRRGGARTGPRTASRHSDQLGRGHHRGGHHAVAHMAFWFGGRGATMKIAAAAWAAF